MGIGKNLKVERERAGWTQEVLADRADVQQSDVSKWENDKVTPDLESALKVAAALECPLDVLVQGLIPQYDAARDLGWQGRTPRSALQPGGADDAPTTRQQIIQLRRQIERANRLKKEAEDAAALLARAVAAFHKGDKAHGVEPRRGGAHRKTG